MIKAALDRLKANVIDAYDWPYVEGETDSGKPDLADDVKILCSAVEALLGLSTPNIDPSDKTRPMRPLSRIRGMRK